MRSAAAPAINRSGMAIFESVTQNSAESHSGVEPKAWLFSRRADLWLASGGASLGLLAAVLITHWHGDRELDALDFVLSEFHVGATYGAIFSRRLWRQRQVDVLLIPLLIIVLTYALSMSGQKVLLTSIAMYAAVWHRGRQSLGVARFYQKQMGGPVSRAHHVLFRGAIYLPMLAAVLAYTHLSPTEYENEPYFALSGGAELTSIVGLSTALWVSAYFFWMFRRNGTGVHPGECWVVLAHAVAFGSGYVLGGWNASFILVLAVHHEVQYIYFTYCSARRATPCHSIQTHLNLPTNHGTPNEIKFAAIFLLWPAINFVAYVVGDWLAFEWLAPIGVGGLFCHYWLDGRIWTGKAR
jgi:hypothetical protein